MQTQLNALKFADIVFMYFALEITYSNEFACCIDGKDCAVYLPWLRQIRQLPLEIFELLPHGDSPEEVAIRLEIVKDYNRELNDKTSNRGS